MRDTTSTRRTSAAAKKHWIERKSKTEENHENRDNSHRFEILGSPNAQRNACRCREFMDVQV
jgi:hypothetical protein